MLRAHEFHHPMAMSQGRSPEINVTPLIDVLLVLLIIFMVVAPTRPGQFETKVPSRPPADQVNPPATELLVVTLSSDGQLSLNGTRLAPADLGGALLEALIDRADRTVIVRAPTGAPYRDVVAIVDAVSGAGASTIGLQVDFLDA